MEEVSTYTSTQDNERKTTEVNNQVSTGIDELCVAGRIIATTVHEKQSQSRTSIASPNFNDSDKCCAPCESKSTMRGKL